MRLFHIFWTIALFAVFVGIWIWAWSGRRKKDFADAARLPLDDDESAPSTKKPDQEKLRG